MQERCPICQSPLRTVGSVKECSRDITHPLVRVRRPLPQDQFQPSIDHSAFSPTAPATPPPAPGPVPVIYPTIKTREEPGWGFWRRILCPFCNQPFRVYEAAVVSNYTRGKELQGPKGPRPSLVFRSPVLNGPHYLAEQASYQCPSCKLALPRDYESSLNLYIAVMGNLSAGKTHYIAALLDQMERSEMTRDTVTRLVQFLPQSVDTANLLKQYREGLQTLTSFRPTQGRVEGREGQVVVYNPLVFRMRVQHQGIVSAPRPVNLLFYDIAGEDMADPSRLEHFSWPILRAHAFIYLADPLSMKQVREKLAPEKRPQGSYLSIVEKSQAHEVFVRATESIQKYRRQSSESKLAAPVAFMLAKADLLDGLVAGSPAFLRSTHYDGLVNWQELEQNSAQIQNWLQTVGEGRLVSAQLLCFNSCYFAVSATGCSLDVHGKFPHLQPRRCLDPLLWILWCFAGKNDR
jgi:hypothetical protein